MMLSERITNLHNKEVCGIEYVLASVDRVVINWKLMALAFVSLHDNVWEAVSLILKL